MDAKALDDALFSIDIGEKIGMMVQTQNQIVELYLCNAHLKRRNPQSFNEAAKVF